MKHLQFTRVKMFIFAFSRVVKNFAVSLVCWNCCFKHLARLDLINTDSLYCCCCCWMETLLWPCWVIGLKSYRRAEKGLTLISLWVRCDDSACNVMAVQVFRKALKHLWFVLWWETVIKVLRLTEFCNAEKILGVRVCPVFNLPDRTDFQSIHQVQVMSINTLVTAIHAAF